ncbi:uncharacterized protein FYW47_016615 [Aplochiton taeniatus]
MATCITFQTQLSSIMDVLAKAAVVEISKLVDDKYAVLRLEISQKQNEIEILKRKLLMMENNNAQLLHHGIESYSIRVPTDWRNNQNRVDDQTGAVGNRNCHATGDNKFSEIENASLSFIIKEERLDDELWANDSHGQSIGEPSRHRYEEYSCSSIEKRADDKHQFQEERAPPEATDGLRRKHVLETNHEPHGSGHEEEIRGLELVIKAEKEEKHSGFSPHECQHSAAKQGDLATEFTMDEGESQLWSSIIAGNDIDTGFPDFSCVVDQFSQTFTGHSDKKTISAPTEVPGVPKESSQRPCIGMHNNEYQKDMGSNISTFASRTQADYPQQDQHNDQLGPERNVNDSNSKLQHRYAERIVTVAERPTGPQSHNTIASNDIRLTMPQTKNHFGTTRAYICPQCGKSFSRLPYLKIHQQSHKRKRPFWCTVCGKTFQCSSHLSTHYRTHTGEKPYGCVTCGKRFTQQSSLRVHQRTHSGERPYSCSQCGKTFILMHHLKRHRIIHNGYS